jgi:spermidine synthase
VIPWRLLAPAPVPGGEGELRLFERAGEFAIRIGARELMSSRSHASEEALGALAAAKLASRAPRVLIGGLGMGYTLAAALRALGPRASLHVAELVPAVIDWNRGPLAHLAGRPLEDPRVSVEAADVATRILASRSSYDAILLDVDNGPEASTRPANDWLYAPNGLQAARAALRRGGVLAIWSASSDRRFTRRLRAAGFAVEPASVPARSGGRGRRSTVWIAVQQDVNEVGRRRPRGRLAFPSHRR